MSIFFVCNYTVIVNFLSVSTLSLCENICKDIIMFDEAKTVLKNKMQKTGFIKLLSETDEQIA